MKVIRLVFNYVILLLMIDSLWFSTVLSQSMNEILKDQIFIQVEVSKTNVKIDEEIVVSYILYTKMNIASPTITKLPSFNYFRTKDVNLNNIDFQIVTVNNKKYRAAVIKKTLIYAQSLGRFVITPFELIIPVILAQNSSKRFDYKVASDSIFIKVTSNVEKTSKDRPTQQKTVASSKYYNSQYHFKLTIPVDWEEIPYQKIDEMYNEMKQNRNIGKNFFAGFCLQSTQNYFDYPYIILFYVPMPDIKQYSLESVADFTIDQYKPGQMKKNIEEIKLDDMIADISAKETFIDKGRNSFFITTETEVANIGIVKAMQGHFLCQNGIVIVACYSSKDNFQQYFPSFKIFLNSLSFNQGYEFASLNRIHGDSNSSYSLGRYIIVLFFFLSLIIFTFFVMKRNKKNKEINSKLNSNNHGQKASRSNEYYTESSNSYENSEDILKYEEFDDSNISEEEKAKVYGNILELKGKITKSDITRMYKSLIEKYHPDKVGHLGNEFQVYAEKKSKDINKAYYYFKKKYNL